eukprot:2273670-Amphidinium_carterae.1
MGACLLMTAKAGHGASVCDVSSAFLHADLPEVQQVVCYLPEGARGSRDDSGTQIPYLVVKSLYGLRQAPSMVHHCGQNTQRNIGRTRLY